MMHLPPSSATLRPRLSSSRQPTPTKPVGKRPYQRLGLDWTDKQAVNEYKRVKQLEWRRSNHARYAAAVKRWQFNRKLKECGLLERHASRLERAVEKARERG